MSSNDAYQKTITLFSNLLSEQSSDPLDQNSAKFSSQRYEIFNKWQKMNHIFAELSDVDDDSTINVFNSVTIDYLRNRIGTRKFNCTFTVTLDLSKKKLYKMKNDYIQQWRHLKNTMRQFQGTYNYQYYMVPELTKRGVIHGHGIIVFRAQNYDDYEYDRIRWVRKLKLKCGRSVQWTRINDIHNSYMPTESNVSIRRAQSLEKWIEYIHKGNLRTRIGHANQME